jgi:hypothetical protein
MGVRKISTVCPGVAGGGGMATATGMLGSGIEIAADGAVGFWGDCVS